MQSAFITDLPHSLFPTQQTKNAKLPPLPLAKIQPAPTAVEIEPKKEYPSRRLTKRSPSPLRSTQVYRRPSLCRAKSASDALPNDYKVFCVRIRIISNYGDPNYVTCSEIDVLDSESKHISILSTVFDPPQKVNSSSLTNGILIKSKSEDEWVGVWNPNGITIELTVASLNTPTALRIWNGRDHSAKNIKEISISIGETHVNNAVIPQDFGIVIFLDVDKPDVVFAEKPKIKIPPEYSVADVFGEVPVMPCKEMKIEFLSGYSNTQFMGLNAMEIFLCNGKRLNLRNDVKKMTIENANIMSAPQRLFRSNRATMDMSDMFLLKTDPNPENTASLNIIFVKPIPLALIRFWNFNSTDCEVDLSIKNIRISLDNIQVFWGRIKRSNGMITKMEQYVHDVWLTDVPVVCSKVRKTYRTFQA